VALADTRQATIEQPNPDPNDCNPTGEWQLLAAFCLMRATKVQLTMFEVWPPSQRRRGEWCLAYFESLHTSLRTTPQHNTTQHNITHASRTLLHLSSLHNHNAMLCANRHHLRTSGKLISFQGINSLQQAACLALHDVKRRSPSPILLHDLCQCRGLLQAETRPSSPSSRAPCPPFSSPSQLTPTPDSRLNAGV
jgi:hypothetical protein